MSALFGNIAGGLGLLGAGFYLGAYAALQLGFLRGSGYLYTLLNLLGATFVLISLTKDFNLASLIIQVSWITLSVIGLTRMYLRSRKLVFTEDELTLLQERLPSVSKPAAKAFFRAGGWTKVPAQEVLLQEGVNVETLFYLADGEVSVVSDGQEITRLKRGFLGEINVLDGAAASATVVTETASTVFAIARDALQKLMNNDAEFKSAMELGLSRELGQKLVAANRQLLQHSARHT